MAVTGLPPYKKSFNIKEDSEMFFIGRTEVVLRVGSVYYMETRIQEFNLRTENGGNAFRTNKSNLEI